MAEQWRAKWIAYGYDPREDLGVFAFRRRFASTGIAPHAVRVSADNRYRLYCNGQRVGFGPQRGDERHWFFETYDLSPYLRDGDNELVALVWNFGRWAPMAQHTVRTGFVLEDLSSTPDLLSTPNQWEVARVSGWDFGMQHNGVGEFYIDVGPGEIIDARQAKHPPGGEGAGSWRYLEWRSPHEVCTAEDRGTVGGGSPWMLIPATLPPQRYSPSPQKPEGIETSPGTWLYDFGELLCAYPRLQCSGTKGTELRVTYAESLWLPGTNQKGNRSKIEGKEIRGYQDRFILSGGEDVFEPLWWRTFRFVEVQVHAGETPVEAISGTPKPRVCMGAIETGYPYEVESSFEADDPWVKPIWDVSVRTAARCAGETYFDCPYYEQLQYVGDSRIQALIGYYLGRDRCLQRNCVEQISWSLMDNGLTQSRYPSRQTQVIPPFSLWWVVMLYDQMLYDTSTFSLDGETSSQIWEVIVWHWRNHWRQQPADFWCFGDWVPEWRWGVPPGGGDHPMTILLEDFAYKCKDGLTLGKTAQNLREPMKELPNVSKSKGLITRAKCGKWPGAKVQPSEHAEALYRCLQRLVGQDPDPWPTEALARANAAACTYFYSYYKHLAMFGRPTPPSGLLREGGGEESGEFDYIAQLQPWKEQIESGLTTFAENPEPTRSDCHAWSAHPILGFFQIVAGVTSTAPGWKKAEIMPHPGTLRRFSARIAHPAGAMVVNYENERFVVESPIPFRFRWRGLDKEFKAGLHPIG